MNCSDIERILDDGDVAELDAQRRAAVAAHLETCRACALEWEVQTQFVAGVIPAMPPDLAARCKAGFFAAGRAGGGKARTRARPLVLIGLCFGAAAAAFVGAELVQIGSEPRGSSAAVSALSDEDTPEPAQSRGDAESGGAAQEARPTAAGTAVAATDAGSPDTFVLAVSALHADMLDSAARSIVESIRAELLSQLSALPDITVVETEFERRGEPISEIYGARISVAASGRVVTAVDAQVIEVGGAVATTSGTRTFVLAVPPGVARRDPDEAGSAQSGTAGVNLDAAGEDVFVPAALRARIEAVTGLSAASDASANASASASAGNASAAPNALRPWSPIDMVLDNHFSWWATTSTHVDRRGSGETEQGARAAGANARDVAAAGSGAFDYRLDIEATSVIEQSSLNRWILVVRGTGSGRAGHDFEFAASGDSSKAVDARRLAERIVESLRSAALPAGTGLLGQLQARVLDWRLPPAERLDVLEQLQEIRLRTGVDGRDDRVARAVVELGAADMQPVARERLWRAVRGAKNESFVRPLLDAFLYDSNEGVRLEAARTLAADYADQAAVRATFERAAYTEDSPAIRLEASWALRDAAERKRYIRETLLDPSMSDEERVAPLLHALNDEAVARVQAYEGMLLDERERRIVGGADYSDALDADAAQALIEILQRVESEQRRGALMLQVMRLAHPALTRFQLETLRGATDERTRVNASVALGLRLNEPGVREGLEYAAGSDPSPLVREAASRSLSVREPQL